MKRNDFYKKNKPKERTIMNHTTRSSVSIPHEPWYKYGVAALLIEMGMAVAVSSYSLYMTFHGLGGFPGKH